jgi:ankyrin repeat protein
MKQNDKSALMWACEKGRAEVVELLMAAGAKATVLSKVMRSLYPRNITYATSLLLTLLLSWHVFTG